MIVRKKLSRMWSTTLASLGVAGSPIGSAGDTWGSVILSGSAGATGLRIGQPVGGGLPSRGRPKNMSIGEGLFDDGRQLVALVGGQIGTGLTQVALVGGVRLGRADTWKPT